MTHKTLTWKRFNSNGPVIFHIDKRCMRQVKRSLGRKGARELFDSSRFMACVSVLTGAPDINHMYGTIGLYDFAAVAFQASGQRHCYIAVEKGIERDPSAACQNHVRRHFGLNS